MARKDGKDLLNPGKFRTMPVAFLILGFASIAYILNFYSSTALLYFTEIIYAGYFLSIIFLIPSMGDYNVVGLFKKIKSIEFATFDTNYFILLTLFWATSFALLKYRAL